MDEAKIPAGVDTGPDRRPRILIVDDEENIVQILQDFFAERPYEVRASTDGHEALRLVEQGGFDLVLTDINLPGVSGMDILAAAKAADPDVVVLIITGFASTSTAIRALRQGAHDYVTKPFDLWDVDKSVAHGLESRRLVNENRRLLAELQSANAELRRHEEALTLEVDDATRKIRTLYEISRGVNATLEVKRTLNFIVAQAAALSGARGGLLFRSRENGHSLIADVGYGTAAELVDVARVSTGEGINGRVIQTGEPVRVDGELPPQSEPFLVGMGARSVLAVPLINKGTLVGVLDVIDKAEGSFTPEDEELLDSFASHAAMALANAELHEHTLELDRLKSDFVAVVSHEIRTPLTSIQGALELVMTHGRLEDQPQIRELLSICQTNVERLRVLIGDILDFSKIDRDRLPLDFQPVEPRGLVREIVAGLNQIASRRGATLAVEAADLPESIVADRVRVSQVLTNLIDNALKFSPSGGTVHVIVTGTPEGGVHCAVRDEGPGIAAKDHRKLFQKFQQIDSSLTRSQGGLGLGLVISKGIVEGHGGRIWIESELGQGCTVVFTLPAVPPRVSTALPAAA